MPVPSDITVLSTAPSSNSPPGGETPNNMDDYLRSLSAFIAQVRAVIGGATDSNIPKSWEAPGSSVPVAGTTVTDANSANANGWYTLGSPYTNSALSGAPGVIQSSVEGGRIGQVGYFWNGAFFAYQKFFRTYNGTTWTSWKQEIANGESASLISVGQNFVDLGNVTGTATITPVNGPLVKATMTGSTTFDFNTIFVANGKTYPVSLEVAGAFVPSFTGVTWEGGTQPAYVAGMVYRFIVRNDSGGTVTILGSGGTASGVGINQTWQNMTGSRALSTTYTNSTGKPIMISITTNTDSGSGQALGITVAGVLVVDDRSTAGVSQTSAVIIPDGATYSAASNRTLRLWAELR